MLIQRLKQFACLGLIGLGFGVGTSNAQEWYGSQPPIYRGHLEGAERVYLYSPQSGWRLLPVVRGGHLPPHYPQPTGSQVPPSCQPNVCWSGYRDFWVPLSEVHLYQNDPRFRVVTPIPKDPPVAPALPPKPQVMK